MQAGDAAGGLIAMHAETSCLEAMVRAYSAELYRYTLWLCGHRAQAEDLVHEVFARAWRSLASLVDDRAARGWLYTILRREWARQFEKSQPEVADLDDLQCPASVDLGTRTEAVTLRSALERLPTSYRDPLVLQRLGGYRCEGGGYAPRASMPSFLVNGAAE